MCTGPLAAILDDHRRWLTELRKEKIHLTYLRGANLDDVDLSGEDLRELDLRKTSLKNADLSEADLRGSNLSEANLTGANLSEADLGGVIAIAASFVRANLFRADLREADLSRANLSRANLSEANLVDAYMMDSDLNNSDLSNADFRGTNLMGCKNLLNPITWMKENFERDELGYIVYKAFNFFEDVKPGLILEQVVNPLPTVDWGEISFSTIEWVRNEDNKYVMSCKYVRQVPGAREMVDIWRCRISWTDLPGVVVPYNTKGMARCARLELIKIAK